VVEGTFLRRAVVSFLLPLNDPALCDGVSSDFH
jgi:hypothetical protein